jgi:hypothetical protein
VIGALEKRVSLAYQSVRNIQNVSKVINTVMLCPSGLFVFILYAVAIREKYKKRKF